MAPPSFLALLGGRISSTPLALSPRLPMPYQLRTMSLSAVVAPASTSRTVCFMLFDPSGPDGVKISWYFDLVKPVLASRMSDCHLELMPGRCPADGMIMALTGGSVR